MSSDSPVAILFDQNGNPIQSVFDSTTDGYRLQTQTRITDGVDTVGISTVVGMKALKVDVVQTVGGGGGGGGGTSSFFVSSFPTTGTAVGFTDGSLMQGAMVYDLDTGAGTQYNLGVNLRQSANGGSIETGILANPLRIDPTGTTPQPVSQSGSWTITANAGTGTFTVGGTVTSNIGTTGGLALDTSVNGILLAQGSTTSGEKGPLVQGAVTTSAPTYSTGQTSPLSLTTAGALRIDGSGVIQPVSGTITANAGTGTFTVGGTVTANIGTTGGLALDSSLTTIDTDIKATQPRDVTDRAARLLGVVYGSQGQQIKQTATNFNTQVEIAVGSTLIDPRAIRTLTSSDVVTANAGSGTFTVAGTVTANAGTGTFTVGGTITSNQGTPNSLGNAWPVEITDGSNVLGTSSHPIRIDPTGTTAQPVSGTITANAGTGTFTVGGTVTANAGSGTFTVGGTVTANIGTTNGLALDTSVNGILLAQGSTTSGEKGPLIQGAVTTSAPTYTTGQTSPLSLTTAGALRIDGSGVTQPVSGTVTANAGTGTFTVGGTVTANAGTGNFTVVQSSGANLHVDVDNFPATQTISGTVTANQGTSNTLANAWATKITDTTNGPVAVKPASTAPVATDPALVVAISPNSPTLLPLSDVTASGTINAINGLISVASNGCSHVVASITGTWSGTISFQGSIDGSAWIDIPAYPIISSMGSNPASVAMGQEDTTTNGYFDVNAFGYANVRVIAVSWSSGTATIFLRATVGDGPNDVQAVIPADSGALDAFSRQRFSQPESLFSSKQIFDNQPLFWDDQQISGASTTSTYNTNQASTTIAANASVAGVRARQTFRRWNYQSGKGQLVTMTGILAHEGGTGLTGINRRIGYFDANNGLGFKLQATTLGVFVRTFTSGSAVDTFIPQSSWNLDRLDGSGGQTNPSGIKLDVSKTQIFVIDFQWLGTGRVRFGFYNSGRLYYCHQELHTNQTTLVYMSTPNLPLRYEIESLGTGSNTVASVLHICTAVEVEAGFEDIGFQLSADRGSSVLVTGNNSNVYGLIVIRLKSGFGAATIVPTYISVMASDNASFRYGMLLNPTVAGTALSFSSVTNSAIEFAVTDNTNLVSGGTLIFSDYQISSKSTSASIVVPGQLQLGTNIAGVSDIMVIFAQPTPSSSTHFYSSINWREIV
jgi:hypothetical protein